MLLNFSDRTRTGVFNMVWPYTSDSAVTTFSHSTKNLPNHANCQNWNITWAINQFPDYLKMYYYTIVFKINNVNLCVYENIIMGWRFYQYYKDVTYRAVWQSENLLLKQKRCSPRRGIEPRPPAWQAGILTTRLSRIGQCCCVPNFVWLRFITGIICCLFSQDSQPVQAAPVTWP